MERRGSDALRSGLAREKSCRVVQDVTDKGSQEATTESCGDGAMVDADSFADCDGNKREEGARGEGEINSGATCAQSKREGGARVEGGAVLSSFATTETNEQLKDDEKKGEQPGIGTQEPKKKTPRDRDPRTRGDEREMQESVETRIQDEVRRIESENGAKEREAKTKAAAATAVAFDTKARVPTLSATSML